MVHLVLVSPTDNYFSIVYNASLIAQQCYDDCDLCAWRLCVVHACLKTGVSARVGRLDSFSYESERARVEPMA